jgi:hypothetical protein
VHDAGDALCGGVEGLAVGYVGDWDEREFAFAVSLGEEGVKLVGALWVAHATAHFVACMQELVGDVTA